MVPNVKPEVSDNKEWKEVVSKKVKKAVNKSERVLKPQVKTTSSTIHRTAGGPRMPVEIGMVGTADMAFYCFALAVKKTAVNKVKLRIAGSKPVVLLVGK